MAIDPMSSTAAAVVVELGPDAHLLSGRAHLGGRAVRSASIWSRGQAPAADEDVVLVCPPLDGPAELAARLRALPPTPVRCIVLSSPAGDGAMSDTVDHVVVEMAHPVDPADLVMAVARVTQPPEETVARRLAAVQRRLTQALGDAEPVTALLSRLHTLCHASVAVVDQDGHAVHATGPLPLALVFGQLTRTLAESQRVDVEGWHGIADRIADPSAVEGRYGWLVAVSQRPGFPDVLATSTIHVAATLVETSRRMTQVAQEQERAIRAAVLEEALALQAYPQNSELAGRISSFGVSFDEELHTVVAQPVSSHRERFTCDDLARRLQSVLSSERITHLATTRNDAVVLLVQCSGATLRRALIAHRRELPRVYVGVGRRARRLGQVVDSHHDARLGVQTLGRRRRPSGFMRYEDFDIATRLFADVGIERMTEWAREFLAPLRGREALYEGLKTYFESGQNMNAAADTLKIHHNSLRYRLAKVESLLNIRLREPSAVSSVFLALTALAIDDSHSDDAAFRSGAHVQMPAEVDAPRNLVLNEGPEAEILDAALAPER
jgi:sugar diacid utilization regulator